jgi:glutamate dehydrogenase/leucine dehydrogenase
VNGELANYMTRAYQKVADTARSERIPLRQAAYRIAIEKVLRVEELRGT